LKEGGLTGVRILELLSGEGSLRDMTKDRLKAIRRKIIKIIKKVRLMVRDRGDRLSEGTALMMEFSLSDGTITREGFKRIDINTRTFEVKVPIINKDLRKKEITFTSFALRELIFFTIKGVEVHRGDEGAKTVNKGFSDIMPRN